MVVVCDDDDDAGMFALQIEHINEVSFVVYVLVAAVVLAVVSAINATVFDN